MYMYERKIKIGGEYAAMNGYMRAACLFDLLQQAAGESADELGIGKAATSDVGCLWMIVHMRVRLERMPRYYEDILLHTWPGGTKHGMYPRYYELIDESGETILRASATWVLADVNTRGLAPAGVIELPTVITGKEIELPRRVRLPELENETVFTARYSQADVNGHMNNARYLDLAEDLMPIDYLMRHTLREADIDYLHEIIPGQSVKLTYGEKDGAWCFAGDTDTACFKMKLKYEQI